MCPPATYSSVSELNHLSPKPNGHHLAGNWHLQVVDCILERASFWTVTGFRSLVWIRECANLMTNFFRNPNLGTKPGKRVLNARILDPNSEKFTSRNSPSKIQPRNRAEKFTLHLCRAVWMTKFWTRELVATKEACVRWKLRRSSASYHEGMAEHLPITLTIPAFCTTNSTGNGNHCETLLYRKRSDPSKQRESPCRKSKRCSAKERPKSSGKVIREWQKR